MHKNYSSKSISLLETAKLFRFLPLVMELHELQAQQDLLLVLGALFDVVIYSRKRNLR